MESWQQRVIKERNELKERLQRLVDFQKTAEYNDLPETDRILLARQKMAMFQYLSILKVRIE